MATPHPRHRLFVPHEELRVFLEDVVRALAGHGNDGGVVAFLPCHLESGTDRLEAEDLELFLGLFVVLEFLEQRTSLISRKSCARHASYHTYNLQLLTVTIKCFWNRKEKNHRQIPAQFMAIAGLSRRSVPHPAFAARGPARITFLK